MQIKCNFVFEEQGNQENEASTLQKIVHSPTLRVALLIFAGGADNIEIYPPLFARFSPVELLLTLGIFMLLVPLWYFLGEGIANYPIIKTKVENTNTYWRLLKKLHKTNFVLCSFFFI